MFIIPLHCIYQISQFLIFILVDVNIFANYSFHNLRLPHKISPLTVRQLTCSIFYSSYTIHFLKAAGNVLHGDPLRAIFRRWVSPRRTCDFFCSREPTRADSLRDSSNFVEACGAIRRPPNAIKVAFFNWLSPGGTSDRSALSNFYDNQLEITS